MNQFTILLSLFVSGCSMTVTDDYRFNPQVELQMCVLSFSCSGSGSASGQADDVVGGDQDETIEQETNQTPTAKTDADIKLPVGDL